MKFKEKFLPTFINSSSIDVITTTSSGCKIIIPNIEPLVNEKCEFTNIIGIYSKDGALSDVTQKFIKKYRKSFKFIWLSSSGPYFEKNISYLYKHYDAVTSLDCTRYPVRTFPNNLELSYSMFTRCAPIENGFFWEPEQINKDADFSILTWYGDPTAKVWPDAFKVIIGLCSLGYKGIIVTQRGKAENILADEQIKKFAEKGLVEIYTAEFDTIAFHKLMSRSYVGIFPNQSDAFPKHIIETLLEDKGIVISNKLLFGVETLKNLGSNITLVEDFADNNITSNIAHFIDKFKETKNTPRFTWLEKYGFDPLSRKWAGEINGCFGTNFKKVFCMKHIHRFSSYLKD